VDGIGDIDSSLSFTMKGMKSRGNISFNAILQNLLALRIVHKMMIHLESSPKGALSTLLKKLFTKNND
jgi:hypothetical protein